MVVAGKGTWTKVEAEAESVSEAPLHESDQAYLRTLALMSRKREKQTLAEDSSG